VTTGRAHIVGRKLAASMGITFVQSLFLAACASAGDPTPPKDTAPPAPAVAFKDRRMSEFTPDFAGQIYDLRCGDCSYAHAIDVCVNLGRSSAVVRASLAAQSPPVTQCRTVTEHDRTSACQSDVELTLQGVEILRGSIDAGIPQKVRARFHYTLRGYAPKTSFLEATTSYFLFLYPNQERQRFDSEWMALALCPVTAESN
jgi:hypothetical protein